MILKKRKGFTLIEVIVAVSIVIILASLSVPKISGYISKAKNAKVVSIGKQLYSAAMWSYSEKGGSFDATDISTAISSVTGITGASVSVAANSPQNVAIVFTSDSVNYQLNINASTNIYSIRKNEAGATAFFTSTQ